MSPQWFMFPINAFVFDWGHVWLLHFSKLSSTMTRNRHCRESLFEKCFICSSVTVDLLVICGSLGASVVFDRW